MIVVEDDGSGMTKEQIELGWLRPASTIKTNVKERLRTEKEKAIREGKLGTFNKLLKTLKTENKGRIPLGEKGVGRFAAHRLGRSLIIKTKIAANDYEYVLKINWDDFNATDAAPKDLEAVPIVLTRQSPSRDYGAPNSGTQLIIYGGREGFELTKGEIRAINKTILELNSPNPNPVTKRRAFRASFACPQEKDLKQERPSFDPVFRLYGLVDENGVLDYDYHFDPPNNIPLSPFNQKRKKRDLKTWESRKWSTKVNGQDVWRKPACGEFYIHLDVWIRDNPWLGNSLDEKEFKAYLREYGGISLYRDQINIFPAEWGAETDWLGLRQRQIQQARRISYYHMIGNVEIDQLKNVDLVDKTNREGLIHNQAFTDLADLVNVVVRSIVEVDYMGKRDEYKQLSGGFVREARQQKTYSKQSADIITNMNASDYDVVADPYRFFANVTGLGAKAERHGKLVELSKSLKNLEENLKQIQEVQDMLTEQAGFGLGIAVVLHEISKTTSNFYFSVLDLIKKKKFDLAKLEELKETSRSLESELTRLAPLRALRNEPPITFKVSRSISYVESIFRRRFNKLGILFSYNRSQDFEIYAKYSALNQILTNLIDNSRYWLDNPDIKQRKIQLGIDSRKRTITVADTGPGLADSILPYLFQPGYSLKNPPSGLGLYVSRYYMNLMKRRGDIYLANERDRISDLPGAQFVLDFSKVAESDEK